MGLAMSSSVSYGREQFYFDPDVDSPPKPYDYIITNYELRKKIENLPDALEKINAVRYYTHPLNTWQMSKYFLHHAFVVLETESGWWSIEKDEGGITVQRSKYLGNVRDKCRRQNRITGLRSGIDLARNISGNNVTVFEILDHLWKTDRMNLHYHFLGDNCQHFADHIYNFFILKSYDEALVAKPNYFKSTPLPTLT